MRSSDENSMQGERKVGECRLFSLKEVKTPPPVFIIIKTDVC
jgi:hypothetical protein